ncbi:anti-sigma factor family protein [Sediminibacillus halophilus]|uniref:Anti-sigma-W factor RsiW n=1 Tax=Sediminibacillus halophilus TaxID=482461 RepID=A0A1G9XB25_9BACI|nr:anti-sigma factor [Sediminibacillus halophilus]SDM93533.1 Transmembrane transcriptional regulator (anti-sigma factor RsiW) [Sediminibacillus halophilus]
MSCDKEIVNLMHIYLDGNLSKEQENKLRNHLQSCEACQKHFHELKRTVTMLKSSSEIQAPSDFTANVMNSLPKEKRRVGFMRWFKAHPIITAAAIFFIFMFSGIFSAWNQDGQLSVSKQKNLIIQDDTVIVPEDVVVDGDLVVKNGDVKIEGEVNGDVVIINGDHLMASAGQVSGDLKEVNQLFDWIWYHIKDVTKSVFSLKE